MSTHYIEEAERLADEVAVMAQGKIIARGQPGRADRRARGRARPPRSTRRRERLAEVRAEAEAAGLRVRPAGPAIAIVGSEQRQRRRRARGRRDPRAATLEDVFVLLTGEEAE